MAMGPFDASDKNSLATPPSFDAAVQFNYEIVFTRPNRFNYTASQMKMKTCSRPQLRVCDWRARTMSYNEGCIINNSVFVVL
jgi:hypothetical protein